ncbi:acyl-CoA synthetase family member 2, mitochondrial [Lingula anatina]|uniref:Acyl-CoA synthetase family member 2, mitochondrial n=1 Tax=Lingula anatina TaxID=7574 RepID=A0A1S3GYQ1_LINAN|nr:acyl-CoA synthetase family member 2, mitochondrial [Lingula anatina]|eukprot:XP_013378792.1 acyl-CoA synthetase family member 2, mitochondrial [Lingula anatina]
MDIVKKTRDVALSYLYKPSTRTYDSSILSDYLDRRVKVHPEREAVVLYSEAGERSSLTFRQYHDKSIKVAAGLLRSGLTHGQRALLVAPNTLEFIILQMACARIGVFVLFVKYGASPDEVIQMAAKYKCRAIIVQSSESGQSYGQDVVKAFLRDVPEENAPDATLFICVSFYGGPNTISYDTLTTPRPDVISDLEKTAVWSVQSKVQMEDPLLGMMTSGSTGKPKVVALNHFQFIQATFATAELAEMSEGSRFLNERPFPWAGSVGIGINFIAVIGITLVSMDPEISVKKGDAQLVRKILQDEKCTHVLTMPYMMYDFIKSEDAQQYDLSSLQFAMTGGQPILQESAVAFLEKNPTFKLIQAYGGTSFGYLEVGSDIEIKLVDENQRVVPRGTTGELWVRGPMVFIGYLDNLEGTSRSLTPLRWYKTGDLMVMNDHGQVHIVGRISETIKRATVKIHPAEIEHVLVRHPLVLQAYVVGVPDVRLYEELCACVQLNENEIADVDQMKEIEAWCAETFLPGPDGLTLAPRYFLSFREFPKTGNGKINRRELKTLAIKQLAQP